jgi:alkyl sulfatase BDS1-like metallo-beta-lactamase superfamily hydrolase
VLDGVKLRFQVTPGTEAPAEMNIGFPDWKVADLAENANVTQHNILTPRGAVVRNAKAWAQGLTEAIDFFAGADVMITSHGWPRFGAAEITTFSASTAMPMPTCTTRPCG